MTADKRGERKYSHQCREETSLAQRGNREYICMVAGTPHTSTENANAKATTQLQKAHIGNTTTMEVSGSWWWNESKLPQSGDQMFVKTWSSQLQLKLNAYVFQMLWYRCLEFMYKTTGIRSNQYKVEESACHSGLMRAGKTLMFDLLCKIILLSAWLPEEAIDVAYSLVASWSSALLSFLWHIQDTSNGKHQSPVIFQSLQIFTV